MKPCDSSVDTGPTPDGGSSGGDAEFGSLARSGAGGKPLPAGATSITNAGGTNLTVSGGMVVPASHGVFAGSVIFDNGATWDVQVFSGYSVRTGAELNSALGLCTYGDGRQIRMRERTGTGYHKSGQGIHTGIPWDNGARDNVDVFGNVFFTDNRAFRICKLQNSNVVGNIFMGQIGSPTVAAQGVGISICGSQTGTRYAHNVIDYATSEYTNTTTATKDNDYLGPFTNAYTIPPLAADVAKMTALFDDPPNLAGEFVVLAEDRALTRAEHKSLWERWLLATGSPASFSANGGTMAHDTGLERCDYDAGTFSDP